MTVQALRKSVIKEKESTPSRKDLNTEIGKFSILDKFKSENGQDRMRDIMIQGDTGN